MAKRIGEHFRGNVVAYVALFFALGMGTAYALERNSVRSKHIVNGQVSNRDTKPITGSWVKDPAPIRITNFLNGWAAYTGDPGTADDAPVRVWKDVSGTVHLEGAVTHLAASQPPIFRLPEGFRPATNYLNFPVVTTGEFDFDEVLGYVHITGTCCGAASPNGPNGTVSFAGGNPEFVSLDGISFRAAD